MRGLFARAIGALLALSLVAAPATAQQPDSGARGLASQARAVTSQPQLGVMWGDSLTAAAGTTGTVTVPALTGERMGIPFLNFGIGGQTSSQIRGRMLGAAVTLSGNSIAASGATSITALNGASIVGMSTNSAAVQMLSTQGDNLTRTLRGTLCGVAGIVTRTATGGPPSTAETYTFTPLQTQPAAVACPAGSTFTPISYAAYPTILWPGRNNYTDPATVKADIAAMAAALEAAGNHNWLVLSVLNGDYASEYSGQTNYTTIAQLNADLAVTYGARFVDVRAALLAAYDPAVPQDVTDVGRGVPPSSLRSDAIHLNQKGYRVVAAAIPTARLQAPGRLPTAAETAMALSWRAAPVHIGCPRNRYEVQTVPMTLNVCQGGIQIDNGQGLFASDTIGNRLRIASTNLGSATLNLGGDYVQTVCIGGGGSGGSCAQQSLNNGDLATVRGMTVGGSTSGSATGAAVTQGELALAKATAAASAPGAGFGKLAVVCGTNAGTAKIVAYAGTSSTAVTVIDNVGSGVTGC